MVDQPPGMRTRIVAGAADMLRRRGFTATSVRELAKHSGAPLGSTYHYFPGGKSELATEAVQFADDLTARTLAAQLDAGPRAGLAGFIEVWRAILRDGDFAAGCPVLAVAVDDNPEAGAARAAAAAAFGRWSTLLARSLTDHGVAADRAHALATLVIAAVEGAVVMCRAERTLGPLDEVARTLDDVLAGEPALR